MECSEGGDEELHPHVERDVGGYKPGNVGESVAVCVPGDKDGRDVVRYGPSKLFLKLFFQNPEEPVAASEDCLMESSPAGG